MVKKTETTKADASKKEQKNVPDMPQQETIGFHKGSLMTLSKERQELMRILGIVEQLMQMHVKALQELGVDLQKMADQASKKKPIEDLVDKESKK